MKSSLSEQEKTLFIAVAHWLRDEMVTRITFTPEGPDILYDEAQSNFSYSCVALAEIGVLAPTDRSCLWRVMNPKGADVQVRESANRAQLDGLLNALAWHSDYVTALYRHYELIVPEEDTLTAVCDSMATCGYMRLVESQGTYEWADEFGPWLVRAGAWDLLELETAPQMQVQAVLAVIPEKDLSILAKQNHQPDFVNFFFAQWVSGKWQGDRWRTFPCDEWDLPLAAGLYVHLIEDHKDIF